RAPTRRGARPACGAPRVTPRPPRAHPGPRRRGGPARRRSGAGTDRSGPPRLGLADVEVAGVGVMEDQRRDRRLRLHHELVGEAHADVLLGLEQPDEALLGLEAPTGGITE